MKLQNVFGLLAFVLVFASCQKQDTTPTNTHNEEAEATIVDGEINGETLDFMQSLDVNLEDAVLVDMEQPDGTIEEMYIVEGDIMMTKEQYQSYKSTASNAENRQYRTYNLVNNYKTYKVMGYNSGSSGLSSNMKTALSWTVANYNALNTGLTLSLSYGGWWSSWGKDIVVRRQNNGAQGGVAGFPSGGKPHKNVYIYSGLDNANINLIEHVMTHELGHCFGLRHTDWSTRYSCGGPGESAGSSGAVHIPGTPTGLDFNSVMEACFSGNENGEFGYYDRVALEYLY